MATKNRAELKRYFLKNAIPTEGNYADLIDSQLNGVEDGVFKQPGAPLGVIAADQEQRRVLQLHGSSPTEDPDWVLSLNPQQAPGDPATRRAGLGITDGAAGPRLFLDKATGRVGIGTNDPQAELDVRGDARISAKLTVGNKGDNSVLRFEAANHKNAEIGVQDDGDQGFYVRMGPAYRLSVNQNGNVGVGVDLAGAKLHVDGNVRIKSCTIEPTSKSVAIPQEDWQAPVLGHGWLFFGAPYNPVAYFKDSCGVVHLRGLIKGGALSSWKGEKPVFTLPAGYRPAGQELHGVCSNTAIGRVDIASDGRVFVVAGNNLWLSLDGISFRAAS
ncbi:MAG: hypothetical protein R3B48_22280 [Kofleriaceae bacterium]